MIEFSGVSVRYGVGVEALQGLSLAVPDGAIVSLIGGNGAGKSTVLRALSGVLGFNGGKLNEGEIRLDGRRIDGLRTTQLVAAGVSHVPEGRRIFASLTVEDNLRAGASRVKSRADRSARIALAYDTFEVLGKYRTKLAGLLSGGEQQMLAIARGMMTRPRVLLLDEPSLGLAPQMVEQIARVVQNINRDGTTIVLVEQNAAMALRISHEGHVIERGRIVLSGTADELSATDKIRSLYLGGQADEFSSVDQPASVPSLPRWVS